jgi:hypothetical protein
MVCTGVDHVKFGLTAFIWRWKGIAQDGVVTLLTVTIV